MTPERVTLASYIKASKNHSLYGAIRYPVQNEHIARYRFAAGMATYADTVVDAPSGAGWGAALLAKASVGKVVGIDRDEEAICEAASYFSRENLSFVAGDLLNPKTLSSLGAIDLLVCFELIEHFSRRDGAQFLQNARAVTDTLVLSTPNRSLYSPYHEREGVSANPYHKQEYTLDELQELLDQSGWEVTTLYGQRFVSSQAYERLAQTLYPLRVAATKQGLPADHKLTVSPLLILAEYSAWVSTEQLQPVNGGLKQPVFYTAVCKQR